MDATDRWSRNREEVVEGLRRITSFFLRRLVPQSKLLNSVRRLQQLGLLEPPRSVRTWLRLISEWGIPFVHIPDSDEQDRLLSELATADQPIPLIPDLSLTPLVLYFAALALKFPHPGWLTTWNAVCARISYDGCSLATLFELHTVRHSRSASDFFWCEVFPMAVLRAIAVLDSGTICLTVASQELERLVGHILSHCPSMQPGQCDNRENLLFKILSSFPASNNAPGHPLFISFISNYLLPWIHELPTPLIRPHGLITSTVHVLSHRILLETVLDYSPLIVLYLIRNLADWPRRAQSHVTLIADCLILAYAETEKKIPLSEQLTALLGIDATSPVDTPPASTVSATIDWFRSWFDRLQAGPLSLRTLTKLRIRLLIRQLLVASSNETVKPLSYVAQQLPIPPALQAFVVNCELP